MPAAVCPSQDSVHASPGFRKLQTTVLRVQVPRLATTYPLDVGRGYPQCWIDKKNVALNASWNCPKEAPKRKRPLHEETDESQPEPQSSSEQRERHG